MEEGWGEVGIILNTSILSAIEEISEAFFFLFLFSLLFIVRLICILCRGFDRMIEICVFFLIVISIRRAFC